MIDHSVPVAAGIFAYVVFLHREEAIGIDARPAKPRGIAVPVVAWRINEVEPEPVLPSRVKGYDALFIVLPNGWIYDWHDGENYPSIKAAEDGVAMKRMLRGITGPGSAAGS